MNSIAPQTLLLLLGCAILTPVAAQEAPKAASTTAYSFHVEFLGGSRELRQEFRRAVNAAAIAEYGRKLTNQPSRLTLELFANRKKARIAFFISFDPEWYQRRVRDKPKSVKGERVLYFEPYFGIMQRLLRLQSRFLSSQLAEIEVFRANLHTWLVLRKEGGERLHIPVQAAAEGKLLYPYEIKLTTPGGQESVVKAANQAIFNRYGLFVLGAASQVNGASTVWTPLYQFFSLSP